MANETLALPKQPPDGAPNEHDYQAFCAALSASARGRAFLAEYARRNRHADTQMLLAAFGRLEALVARHTAAPEADRIRQELRALLGAILTARPQIDACAGAVKAAKLVALLELVQRRIEAIVVPVQAASPDQPGAPAMPEAPAAEAARLHLAVVEPPDEPELPIPSPASAQQPPIALVGQDRAQTKHGPEKRAPVFGQDHAQTNSLRTAAIMPEDLRRQRAAQACRGRACRGQAGGCRDCCRRDRSRNDDRTARVGHCRTHRRRSGSADRCSAARCGRKRCAATETRTRFAAGRPAGGDHGAERRRAHRAVYVISRANKSASTLPPDRMPTTTLPVTSSLPASSAASPIAPPGSTTSFSSSNA